MKIFRNSYGLCDAFQDPESFDVCEIWIKKGYHKTREGNKIKISKMTTEHLINTIRFGERNDWSKEYIDQFKKELEKRENQFFQKYT